MFEPKSAYFELVSDTFVVTLKHKEGVFSGVLTRVIPGKDRTLVAFENVMTVPTERGEVPQPYAGQVLLDANNIATWQLVMKVQP